MELNFTGTDVCAINGTRSPSEAHYDVVVVGAGPSGVAAAPTITPPKRRVRLPEMAVGVLVIVLFGLGAGGSMLAMMKIVIGLRAISASAALRPLARRMNHNANVSSAAPISAEIRR